MKTSVKKSSAWLVRREDIAPSTTIPGVISDVRQHGNFIDRWRIDRNVSRGMVALAQDGLDLVLEKKKEELRFRADLALDRAKKQAIAESLEVTAEIEHEISRMTMQVKFEIDEMVNDARNAIYAKEAVRKRELEAAVARGDMLQERLDEANRVVSDGATAMVDRMHAMADHLVENLGRRLGKALSLQSDQMGGT
jgi:predicted ATPase